jgi:hypothetical protein
MQHSCNLYFSEYHERPCSNSLYDGFSACRIHYDCLITLGVQVEKQALLLASEHPSVYEI